MITGQTLATATAGALLVVPGKGSLHIKNEGANTAYIGPATVTDANGYQLLINEEVVFPLVDENDVIYVVCASAESATVHYSFVSAY